MPLFDGKDKSRYATFTRRTLMTGGAVRCRVGSARRSGSTKSRFWKANSSAPRAEQNSVSARLVAPLRGRIFDRLGVELANNRRK